MWSKEKERSIAQLTDYKCRYQSASWKDLVTSRRTRTLLLYKLSQYANKLLSAEPPVLKVLNAYSNSSSAFIHLLHWLVIFTWFLLESRIKIKNSLILSNSSENASPSEECNKEYTWSCSVASAIRDIYLLPWMWFPAVITESKPAGLQTFSLTDIFWMTLHSRYVPKQPMTTFSKWKPPIPRNILLNFCGYKSCISFAVWYTPLSDQWGSFLCFFCFSVNISYSFAG